MKILNILLSNKTNNKYDIAIGSFYLLFYASGFIVFFLVGLDSMKLQTWVLAFFCSAFGATVYGTLAKMIINLIRKDKQENKADILVKLFYIIFFSLATVAFLAIGLQEKNIKTWLIAFVGSYGTATIFSTIARLIVTLARKDNLEDKK